MLLTEDQVERISADGLIHDAQRLKELQQDIIDGPTGVRRRGFRPIFCNHPECPYKDCRFNQCYITLDDLDKDIWFIDMKCEKYLDI